MQGAAAIPGILFIGGIVAIFIFLFHGLIRENDLYVKKHCPISWDMYL
ncbi:MAG: hypothetical protein LUO89_02025 [Methanothrix sp.]|nr:hypothetical protein [Methanothrix sp.]